MYRTHHRWLNATSIVAVLACASPAFGLHLDVLVQNAGGKLVTGTADFDSNADLIGTRVFNRSLPSTWAGNNPGFNSIGSTTGTLPPGASPLPGGRDLVWDFVPMKVGGVTSDLLYWNGAGTTPADVSFGPPPGPDYSLSLFGKNNARAAADGTGQLIPGQIVDTTASDGFIHIHRYFFLDNDHDDSNDTVAPDGVYLVAMRLRMAGLDRSDPYFIAFGSPGATTAALQAAASWVQDRVDQLSPNFAADFDGDLDVDGTDFITWQRGLGNTAALQIDGDADHDHAVTVGDLTAWKSGFGSKMANFVGAPSSVGAGTSVPEPSATGMTLAAASLLSRRRAKQRPVRDDAPGQGPAQPESQCA